MQPHNASGTPSGSQNRYRLLRELTGLSQREIARRTGINSGRLSVIERGLVPTEAERQALLRVLVGLTEASA